MKYRPLRRCGFQRRSFGCAQHVCRKKSIFHRMFFNRLQNENEIAPNKFSLGRCVVVALRSIVATH
jgi:hypothetical protein